MTRWNRLLAESIVWTSFQRLAGEETQRCGVQADTAHADSAHAQVCVLASRYTRSARMCSLPRMLRHPMDVTGEIFHNLNVGFYDSLRELTALEF